MVDGLVMDGPVVGLTPRACIPPPTNKYTNNEAHNKQCTRVRPIITKQDYCENYNAMEMQNQQAGLAGIHPYQE